MKADLVQKQNQRTKKQLSVSPRGYNKSALKSTIRDKKGLLESQESDFFGDSVNLSSLNSVEEQLIEVGQMSVTTPGIAEIPPQAQTQALKFQDSRASKYATISNNHDENRVKYKTVVIENQQKQMSKTVTGHGATSQAKKSAKAQFNPEIYRFKKPEYNAQQELFKQQFYEHNKANKSKINKQLVEQTYLQVLNRFEKEKKQGDFPTEFRQNEMKWAAQMMKSKKLQKLMAEMTDRVGQVLEDELHTNRNLIKDWISHPHSHSVSPQRNQIQLQQMRSPVWYPENPPISAKVHTVYNKHRKHLNALAEKKRQDKLEQEEIEESNPMRDSSMATVKSKKPAQGEPFKRQNNIHIAARRNKAKKPEKPSMTPYQQDIFDHLQIAQGHLEKHEEIDELFQEHLEEIEKDLRETSKLKEGKNPGNQIKHLLTKWADEPVYTEHELAQHRNELWISLEQFESDLKNQEYAMEVELKNLKIQYRTRVDGIRAQTSFRIEALESALIETKIRYSREVERAQMQLSEMESRMLNNHLNNEGDQLERVRDMEQTLQDPQFQDIDDSQKVKLLEKSIKRLMQSIMAGEQNKIELSKEIKELQSEIDRDKEFNEKTQSSFAQSQEHLLYYQQTLYEMLENTGMLAGLGDNEGLSPLPEEKQDILRELFDLNAERIRQDEEMAKTHIAPSEKKKLQRLEKFVNEFHKVILEVDFRSILESYQQVMKQKDATINEMTMEFANLGVIDLSKLESKPQSPSRVSKLQNSSPISPQRRLNMLGKKNPELSQEEQTALQFEQHIIKVDGLKMHHIQEQFRKLKQPVQEGISNMIETKELLATVASQESSEGDGVSIKKKKGAFGLDNSQIEAKSKLKNPKERQVYKEQLKKNQAKRVDEQEKRERKAAVQAEKKAKNRGGASSKPKKENSRMTVRKTGESNYNPSSHNVGRNEANSKSVIQPIGSDKDKDKKSNKQRVTQQNQTESHLKIQLKKTNKNNDTSEASDNLMSDEESSSRQKSESSILDQSSQSSSKIKSSGHSPLAHHVINSPSLKSSVMGKSKKEIKSTIKASGSSKFGLNTARNNSPSKKHENNNFNFNEKQNKPKVTRNATGLSVSITKNESQKQVLQSQQHSDVNSDDHAPTEPIITTQAVLEELENKVLDKYAAEIEEMEQAEEKMFKLKAGQNKEIAHAFIESIGQQLTDSEETEFMMTGNLPQMIDLVNETRDKYITKKYNGISIKPMGETMISIGNVDETNFNIPVGDCILTQLNEAGEITGFRVRPEIAKVMMYREEGHDVSSIVQACKTVNYLNRLFFQTDKDYWLGIKGEKMPSNLHSINASRASLRGINVQNVELDQDRVVPTGPSSELTELLELLKMHSQKLLSQGVDSKSRYYQRMMRDQTIEDLMHYKMENVFENLTQEDRGQIGPSHTSFFSYLQILFQHLENKMTNVLPKENIQHLSVNELVNYGAGTDPSALSQLNKLNKNTQCQTDDKLTQEWINSQAPKKSPKHSPYSQAALSAQGMKRNQFAQTDMDLLEDFIQSKHGHLSMVAANKHIDQQVGQEMEKTIASLNSFVNKVQMSQQLNDKEAMQQAKSVRKGGASSMFDTNRRSMATQMSSTVSDIHSQMPLTPVDQLRAIRRKVETTNEIVQSEIDRRDKQKDKQMSQRNAEFSKKRQELDERNKKLTFNQVQLNQSKFPNLSKVQQNIQSERNYAQTIGCEVSNMPMLNNSNTKPSTLVAQPFKQVHVDKRVINQDSTQSKFSSHVKELKDHKTMNRRRSQSGMNPPGLTARKVDYMNHRSPQKLIEGQIVINDSSLESKDFGRTTTGSMMKGRNFESQSYKNGVGISSNEFSAQNQRRNTRLRNDHKMPFMNMTGGPSETDQRLQVFTPIGMSYEQSLADQSRQMKISQQQRNNPKGVMDLQLSLISTPQSSSLDYHNPFTPNKNGGGVLSNRETALKMHIQVGKMEKPGPEEEVVVQRKTSTTMMMMPKINQQERTDQMLETANSSL